MIKNYFKIAFRNLLKNKVFSLINLTGLSVGTAIVILIMLFVKNEWSYDQFHTHADNIYRAWVKEHFKGELIFNSVTPLILGPELENNFPEIKAATRILNTTTLLRKGAQVEEEVIHYVDPAFFEMFDFPLLKGQKEQVFSSIHQAVITPETGLKYFNDTSPVGQTLSIQVSGEWTDFIISGIIEKAPNNSSIQYQILLPFEKTRAFFSERAFQCWTCVYGETYVQIDPNSSLEALDTKIAPFIDSKVKEDYQPGEYIVGMQPITDIHLNKDIPAGMAAVSDARYPYILASIALLILLLAGINFTTLSIGRSVSRAKEVGVRKVTGATRWQLRFQFWCEAILTSSIALLIGIGLAWALLPFFNSLAEQQLTLNFNLQNIAFFVGLALLIGLGSGIYPALVLSGFAPIQAIRGYISKVGDSKHLVLRGLVGFQFVLSIFLIICTFGMKKQMSFLQNKNLGFDREQLVVVPFNGKGNNLFEDWEEALKIQERLKSELAGKGVIDILTSSHTFGTPGWGECGYVDEATNKFRQFNVQQIDYSYLDVMGIKLKEGRKFSKENTTDQKAAVINEAFVKAYQLEDPIGATLPGPYKDYQIIGVTDNFNFSSLHSPVAPLVMVTDFGPLLRAAPDRGFIDSPIPKFSFKVEGKNLMATLELIQNSWKKLSSEQSFSYTFLDENIDRQYRSESKLSTILSFATLLGIFIACLGLFGIATLIINQRTKEIGIRKILGANPGSIVLLLNKNFSVLVLIASVIAAPLAWLMMKNWLADFAYRTSMSWWVFVAASLAALVVAWFSVSFQSLKAALTKPVDTLRNE